MKPEGKSMTEGLIWKQILFFTLPIMAGNLLQQLYNTVDGIIVGNFVSEDALASVGTCSPLTMLFIAIAMGMSTGASIAVAQFFGARKMEEMRRSVSTSLVMLTVMGVAFAIISCVGARWMLDAVLGVQDYLLEDAVLYFRIYAIGLIFQFIYNIVSSILRSLGDSKATLYFLLIASVLNIVLDLLFVLVFHWGVVGVAWATVLAQGVSVVVSLVYMFRTHKELPQGKDVLIYDKGLASLMVKMGLPVIIQQCIVSFGHIAIQRVINTFDVTAAYTACMRIENFIMAPIQAFFLGMSTFAGQNLGAKRFDRVKKGLHSTLVMTLICTLAISLIVITLAPQLIALFGVDGTSKAVGVSYLRYMAAGLLMFSWYFAFNGVLQGAGDVMFTLINSLTGLALKILATYILAFNTPMGVSAVWWCALASWLYSLILAALRYKFGPWQKKGVVKD